MAVFAFTSSVVAALVRAGVRVAGIVGITAIVVALALLGRTLVALLVAMVLTVFAILAALFLLLLLVARSQQDDDGNHHDDDEKPKPEIHVSCENSKKRDL